MVNRMKYVCWLRNRVLTLVIIGNLLHRLTRLVNI